MIELLNIDCMEYMAGLKDKAFDLAIVDPPYGVGNFNQEKRKAKPFNKDWEIKWNDSTPTEDYFLELFRVSKNHIIWGANYYNCFANSGGAIIWVKGNSSDIGSQAEIASTDLFSRVVVYKEQWAGFINSENITGNGKIHPCQKPIKLYRWLLHKYAKPCQRILDTHGGSMSIAIACHDMGFDLTLCEIDKDYYDSGVKRYNNAIMQQKLFK